MEKNEYLELFHQMILIRLVEEQASVLYQQGKIGGFLHLYIGQEAVSTGLISHAATPRQGDHCLSRSWCGDQLRDTQPRW